MMPSTSDLAIIVCTRDRPEMLRLSLQAIAAATPGEAEIVVVDSASSTSATREVAAEFDTTYVRADIKGLSIARNLGLKSTQRPFVIFTDDDCLAADGWAQRAVEHFADGTVGAVTGQMLDHTLLVSDVQSSRKKRFHRAEDGLDAGHGAVMAFRRELVLRLGGFDDVLGAGRELAGAEDLDIFCRILWAGSEIVYDEKCLVRHANTRVGDAYTELYRGYGLGLGALANKWLRLSPTIGLPVLGALLKRRIVDMVQEGFRAGPERAMFRGMAQGFVVAARMPLRGERFVERPALAAAVPDDAAVST
ncbi:glycosyltransferase [soil metagenome]